MVTTTNSTTTNLEERPQQLLDNTIWKSQFTQCGRFRGQTEASTNWKKFIHQQKKLSYESFKLLQLNKLSFIHLFVSGQGHWQNSTDYTGFFGQILSFLHAIYFLTHFILLRIFLFIILKI